MSKKVQAIVTLLLAGMTTGLAACAFRADSTCEKADPLECYLELEKSIPLSNDVMLSHILFMDVDDAGRMLLSETGRGVHLFDADGSFLRSLDVEPCHPGFPFFPIQALFEPSGEIFLMNSGVWGYRFAADGSCKTGVDPGFITPRKACFSGNGLLHGYSDYPETALRTWSPEGMQLKQTAIQPPPFPVFARHRSGGGLVCGLDGDRYLAHSTSPTVSVYGSNGAILRQFSQPPSFFASLERDAIEGEIPDLIESTQQASKGRTTLADMYLITPDILMLQYRQEDDFWAVDFVRTDGDRFSADALRVPSNFIFAGNGRAYRIVQPSLIDSADVPNPTVEVFRFVED